MTDSEAKSVTVSSEGTSEENLVGSSQNNGSTWTAIVTDSNGGDPLTGTWDYPGTSSCSDNTCTLSGIRKRQGSVTFTSDGDGGSITITKS